jgi:phospholipid/cholesterol/gamma-HCH transport system permease protein
MNEQATISLSRIASDTLLVRLTGTWQIGKDLPQAEALLGQIESEAGLQRIAFDTQGLKGWDSGLLTFVVKVTEQLRDRKIVSEKRACLRGFSDYSILPRLCPKKRTPGKGKSGLPFWKTWAMRPSNLSVRQGS